MGTDIFDVTNSDVPGANGEASPDLWRNLAAFGAAVSASANARDSNGFLTYGPGLGGPLGAGLLQAQQASRTNAKTSADIGNTRANTGLLNSEVQKNRVQNTMMLQGINFQRSTMGLPPLDANGNVSGSGQNLAPGYQPPSSQGMAAPKPLGASPTGMPSSPSAGMSSRIVGAPENFRSAPADQGGRATPQAAQGDGPMGIPLPVWQGQQAPSQQQAGIMANAYDMYGDHDRAKQFREYALTPKEGFATNPDYSQKAIAGGPADPRYKGQVAASEGWGKAGPELYVDRNKPSDLRAGGVRYDPVTGNYVQVEERVTGVDPTTGAHFLQPAPLGVVQGNVNTGAAPQQGPAPIPSTPTNRGAFAPQQDSPTATAPAGAAPSIPGVQPQSSAAQVPGAPTGLPGFGDGRVVQTELGPGQKKIIEGAAENYTAEGKKAYESAVDLKGSIEYIKRDLDTLGPEGFLAAGSGADARLAFAKAINSALQVGGLQPTFDPNKIGAWEDFKKESVLGGMKGLSAIFGGSREAASIISTSIGAFPHPENSYQGAKLLTNAFDEAANHEIDKRNFETNWIADPKHTGNLTGANEAFNQQYPSAKYTRRAISQVKPYEVKGPEEMTRYMPGTRVWMKGKVDQNGKPVIALIPGPTGVQLDGSQ